MEHSAIEAEIRRLSPWYYLWELQGVRTDITPPCDDQGHRIVSCPEVAPGFWSGKSVLDVACNEGAYGMGALGHGAASLVGFDVRADNVEKARFVARLLGHEATDFTVADCDSWLQQNPGVQFDAVLMCGILYHLPDPQSVIRAYCDVARDWIFVTCCVTGNTCEPGYTLASEIENIAASADAQDSLMPNEARTLIQEFQQSGFEPVYVEEVCKEGFWDGVSLQLRNCRSQPLRREALAGTTAAVDVYVAPTAAEGTYVTLRNATPAPVRAAGKLLLRDAAGEETLLADEPVELPARSIRPDMPSSSSVTQRIAALPEIPTGGAMELRVEADGAVLGGLSIRPA